MLEDLREADVATMLSLFQQAGHYATHHGAVPRPQGFPYACSSVRPQWGAVAASSSGQLDPCPWHLPPGV